MEESKRQTLKTREEIAEDYKWDLSQLYEDDNSWEEEFNQIKGRVSEMEKYQGKLGESADTLLAGLNLSMELNRILEKLYSYAARKNDENTTVNKYQGMKARIQALYSNFASITSFMVPEIIQIPIDKLQSYLAEKEDLKLYQHYLDDIMRQKSHYLSPQEEKIIALAGEVTQSPSNIFGMINNADIAFPTITGEDGEEIEVTHGRYIDLLKDKNRHIRRDAFKAYYSSYQELENTLSMTLSSNVKKNIFYRKVRNYEDALEASLAGNKIPVEVYTNLIDTVSKHLDSMYKYIDLRQEALELDQLHMYDLYTPIVKDVEMKVTYEESQEIILEALKPLGEEYLKVIEEAFESSWIDVYENKGKRSGAYSASCYDAHPYILMNYTDSIDNLFTLAHELGHAMHSYYSNQTQPYLYADYSIFVAEVASTVNEALLMQYLLKTTEDEEKRKYILNYHLEQFRGTVYRQTMFAEFEKSIHDLSEQGQALTPELLAKEYHDLNQKYYGQSIVVDDEIDIEWARIPHFYYNFYVYQYATGFSAAITLSQKILEEGQDAVDKYLNFLKSGSSDYPIELLKQAGVDMTTPDPIEKALKVFEELVEEMKELVLAVSNV